MQETFNQKVLRNIQGHFAVYKTTEVVGDKSFVPNLEWENSEDVDSFFQFAKQLGAKIIYVTQGEEFNEETQQSTTSILQVGFIHQGIMHHINIADDDEDNEDDDEDEYDDIDEEGEVDEDEFEDEDYEEDNGAKHPQVVQEHKQQDLKQPQQQW